MVYLDFYRTYDDNGNPVTIVLLNGNIVGWKEGHTTDEEIETIRQNFEHVIKQKEQSKKMINHNLKNHLN